MDQSNRRGKRIGLPRTDFIMGLILLVFGLAAVYQSFKLPTFEKDWGGFYAAPGLVPLLLGGIISVLSLCLMIRSIKEGGYHCLPGREALYSFFRSKRVHRYCLVMAYSWFFFFILGHIHFYLAAFLVLFVYMATFSRQKIYVSFIISATVSLMIYLIFTKLFLVPLP